MDALLKNQPYHEMSKDQLDEILYGLGGYDAGTREYSRDETSSTQEEKDAAYRELLARQREADANPVNVFGLDQEDKSRLVDFYEPQFTGQNIFLTYLFHKPKKKVKWLLMKVIWNMILMSVFWILTSSCPKKFLDRRKPYG